MSELSLPEPELRSAEALRGALDARPRHHRCRNPVASVNVFAHRYDDQRAAARCYSGQARVALPDTLHFLRKTSVYLTERESKRLADLARSEGRSQAEIIREAIIAYVPTARGDRDFARAAGYARIDDDPRPISAIPEDELLDGFGR